MKKIFGILVVAFLFMTTTAFTINDSEWVRTSECNETVFANASETSAGTTYDFVGCNSDKQKLILRRNSTCTFYDTDGQAYDGNYTVSGTDITMKWEGSNLRTFYGTISSWSPMVIRIDGESFKNGAC